ncbi:MAG: response regulator [Deltaproteobacteria bacterium]|nr:response regulator [Deltaproteobacteria bacterium]
MIPLTVAVVALAVAAVVAAFAWLRARAHLEQMRGWVELHLPLGGDEGAERGLLEQLVTACGATGGELVLRAADGSTERVIVGMITRGGERIEEELGCEGTLALTFARTPSAARRAMVRRLVSILALDAERRNALARAKLHQDAARSYEKEARAHAELNAQLARDHEAVLEVLPDGVAVTDDAGHIIRVNAAGREIVGVPDADTTAPETRRSLADATSPLLQALREGADVAGLEVAIPGRDHPRTIQVKVSKLSTEPQARAAVALFRDVTRELLLEHDLRRKGHELEQHVQALERATRLKSDFLASMSHELRTPLNAVIGFAEVLLDGTYGQMNEKQQACAQDVLSGGRHLLTLINDILDLSKIEAGRMELALEDLDLADVASHAITFVRPQAAAKAIRIDLEVAPKRILVHGDADRLRQVLVNLLSNAVKFTPRGGRVTVGAESESNALARVWVTDTGIGIAESDRGKLFREFSQVDGSVTRKFGGTGLGLAICKRLVELHGGTIDFESQVGSGSKFWFTVPVAARGVRPTFQPTGRLRRSSSHGRLDPVPAGATALILDGDAASSRLIEGALREAGIASATASSLADARRLAKAPGFEVVIVDPVLDDAPLSEVNDFVAERFGPCVVVASILTRQEAAAGLRIAGFVDKPVDRAALLDQVRAARERKGGPRAALVVDGNEEDAGAVAAILEREGFSVEIARTAAAARAGLERDLAVVVLELDLPDANGIDLLRSIQGRPCKTVVLTERELDAQTTTVVGSLASIVLRKGMLSRSAFARHVTALCDSKDQERPRVLAVDDNEQNLRLISAVLARKGYEILEARDATSAIRIARAELPDVILMDVMLPDVDGLSATRELKSSAMTRAIPIIAVTAQAMAGDADRAREAGCTDYVPKPIDSARLLRAVERAIGASA